MSELENASNSVSGSKGRAIALRFVIIGLIAVAILVGGVGRWFATAKISGAVIAGGTIKVAQNRQIIQHPYGGIVDAVLVTEGAQVEENEVLIKLDSSELTTELQIVESQLAELLVRKSRLQAERDGELEIKVPPALSELRLSEEERSNLVSGQQRLFHARQKNLEASKTRQQQRIKQTLSQIEGLEAQRASLESQKALIGQELVNQEKLLRQGLAQASRVLALQREAAKLDGSSGKLVSDISQAREKIAELEYEIINLDSKMVEDAITLLRDIQVKLFELTERRLLIQQRLDRLEVRAPVSGTVYDLTVFARKAVIRAAEPLLYLVPHAQRLTVEIKVTPQDIEQIYSGQLVNLKFSSFSQRTTPDLLGEVQTVSADAFTEERTGARYFLVEISIKEGEQTKLPIGAALIPGMPVEAFIQTSAYTPLEYFLQPFLDAIDRAFRET